MFYDAHRYIPTLALFGQVKPSSCAEGVRSSWLAQFVRCKHSNTAKKTPRCLFLIQHNTAQVSSLGQHHPWSENCNVFSELKNSQHGCTRQPDMSTRTAIVTTKSWTYVITKDSKQPSPDEAPVPSRKLLLFNTWL